MGDMTANAWWQTVMNEVADDPKRRREYIAALRQPITAKSTVAAVKHQFDTSGVMLTSEHDQRALDLLDQDVATMQDIRRRVADALEQGGRLTIKFIYPNDDGSKPASRVEIFTNGPAGPAQVCAIDVPNLDGP